MKVLDRLGVALGLGAGRPLRDLARRWAATDQREPELARDLVRLGGVVAPAPRDAARRLAADPAQLAYDAGRRDLALELLALMSMTPDDIRSMMEHDDDAD